MRSLIVGVIDPRRHSRERGNPEFDKGVISDWIPAFAGMTK